MIIKAYRLRQKLWKRACEFDNVSPEAPFIVFSENNKYAKRHDRVMGIWFNLEDKMAGRI